MLKQNIIKTDNKLINKDQEQILFGLKHKFNNDPRLESILSNKIYSLINDVDRASYSKDVVDYKNNKKIKSKTLVTKDNKI